MDVFTISPASSKPLWSLAIICLILFIILLALTYTVYSARYSYIELNRNSLKLVGDFWGRNIQLQELEMSGARIVNLTQDTLYAPVRRTFGTGLPGYASGWFRLRNGEKALLYLTQREKVVYLKSIKGYSLLLSLEEPEKFLSLLQRYKSAENV